MTVMFPEFFGVPHNLVRSGLMPRLKPSELALYIGLLHESERYRTREFSRSDQQLHELTGVSKRALRDARIRLQEHLLVLYQLRPGRKCIYVICNPSTGRPFEGDPKAVIPYRRKGTIESASPIWDQHTNLADRAEACPPSRSDVPDHNELAGHGVPINFK
jgi:hypothetical protein